MSLAIFSLTAKPCPLYLQALLVQPLKTGPLILDDRSHSMTCHHPEPQAPAWLRIMYSSSNISLLSLQF